MCSHLFTLICAAGFAAVVLVGTAEEARAACRDKLIGAKSKTNGKYQWQRRCFKLKKGRCVPCGRIHSAKIKYKTRGSGRCSRNKIAQDRADGCSAPDRIEFKGIGVPTPHKYRFNAACYEHDVCYATKGKSKKSCDKMFLRNMKDMCKHGVRGCKAIATAFYAAVVAKGKSSYQSGQAYAKKNCSK